MNKCKINSLVVALVLLVPCLALALPGAHNPSPLNSYTCNSCHVYPASYGNTDTNYTTNLCLRCHSAGGAVGIKAVNKFETEDYANPFNTTNLTRINPLNSSHKWFGGDNVPAAGAQAPVDTNLNGLNKDQYFVNNLFCARCHNVHGTSGEQSNEAPYLRYPNDQDQLCLNCHAPRDHADHTLGTHPVNIPYSSVSSRAKMDAGKLRVKPVVNALNPTGQVQLINGKVSCSTCHRMHNTDSRTGTFDPYSSTHTFNQLSTSKGYLTRVDLYGKTGSDLNICSQCHITKNHNLGLRAGKPAVQCNDCHSGHVEYDPAGDGAALTPNVNLVRRYLQYTTAGRISKRILYRSDTTKEFYNATGNGVCQACHKPTTAHYTGGTYAGSFPAAGYTDCSACHSHDSTAGAWSYGVVSGSCTNNCHGLPPKVTSGTDGPAAGYTRFNEANTPHKAHAAGGGANVNDFDCNECHKGFSMTSTTYNEVFKSPTGTLAGAAATYTGTNCNNVYCHSNGRGTWKPGMNPISWGATAGIIVGSPTECTTCHDDPNSSGAHTKHITGMGYGCVTCHATTVSDNTTLLPSAKIVGGTHTNNIKNVDFNGAGAAVGISCATVKCHSNGRGAAPVITPTWGTPASGQCNACHYTATSAVVLQTGAHSKHFGIIGGLNASCSSCHVYTSETATTHVNGTLDIVLTGCVTCHTDPYSTSSATPTWYSSAPGCASCHTGAGAFSGTGSGPNTGSHNKHMAISGASCAQCHLGAVAGVTGGTPHLDGNIDVTGTSVTGYTANVAKHAVGTGYTGTCSTSCHASPYTTTAAGVSPSWGVVSGGCASCHNGVGAFTGTGSGPNTGSHNKHMAISGANCGQCHSGASATSGGVAHVDGNIDVIGGYTLNLTKHAAGTYTASCNATTCHASSYGTASVVSPTWGLTAGCASCHSGAGAFTATGSSPNTGAHSKHMALSGVTCGNCHAGASATSGGSYHVNNVVDVTGGYTANITKHAIGTYTGTCSSTACHGASTTLTWGAITTNDYCTRCHGTGTATVNTVNRYVVAPSDASPQDVTGKVSSNVKTGAHQTHLQMFNGFSNYSTVDYRCESCHGTLPSTGTYTHADGNSSPVGNYKNLATNWGKMTGQTYSGTTCANTYCHNPAGTNGTLNVANVGSNTTPTWTNSTYIAEGTKKTLANCSTCHKVPGVAGFNSTVFTAHNTAATTYVQNTSCVGCHGHDGDTQGDVGHRHMDGKKWGTGVGCGDCHGYPPLSPADFAARGANFTSGKTEDYSGGGGHHAQHVLPSITAADGGAVCLPCHPYAGLHNQGNGTVLKANIQVNEAGNYAYSFDSTRDRRYNTTTMSCSNVSCHFQPTSSW